MSQKAHHIADHKPGAGENLGLRITLLVCGMVAGPVFFAIFSTAGTVRPDYDPLRHPVSSLEFGPDGWVQSLNFLLTGTLVTLFGLGGPIARPQTRRRAYRTDFVHGRRYRADWCRPIRARSPERLPARHSARRSPPVAAPDIARPLLNAGLHRVARCLHCLGSSLREIPHDRLGDLLRALAAMIGIFFVMSSIAFARGSHSPEDRR
jgi:hypothetical protein